jgi:hypothetical protein
VDREIPKACYGHRRTGVLVLVIMIAVLLTHHAYNSGYNSGSGGSNAPAIFGHYEKCVQLWTREARSTEPVPGMRAVAVHLGTRPGPSYTNPSGYVGKPNSYAPSVQPYHPPYIYGTTMFYSPAASYGLNTGTKANCWIQNSNGMWFHVTLSSGSSGLVSAGSVTDQWLSSARCPENSEP